MKHRLLLVDTTTLRTACGRQCRSAPFLGMVAFQSHQAWERIEKTFERACFAANSPLNTLIPQSTSSVFYDHKLVGSHYTVVVLPEYTSDPCGSTELRVAFKFEPTVAT